MSISGVVLIWLLFNLVFAARVVLGRFVGPARSGSSATLTMIDHHVAAVGGDLWKSDAFEIWQNHKGELQQSLLVQNNSGRAYNAKCAHKHLPGNTISV
jgi:hypothetical protein